MTKDEAMEWLVSELRRARRDEAALAAPDDDGGRWVDVRLQVLTFAAGDEGASSAVLHTGYKNDEPGWGYWGSSIVDVDYTDDDLRAIAAHLWQEAREAFELEQADADESDGA
jgi:hypothetical protein